MDKRQILTTEFIVEMDNLKMVLTHLTNEGFVVATIRFLEKDVGIPNDCWQVLAYPYQPKIADILG